jgi:hypothetical protein
MVVVPTALPIGAPDAAEGDAAAGNARSPAESCPAAGAWGEAPRAEATRRERAGAICERLLSYARALRLEPEAYLRIVASIMEEGPPALPEALDLLVERAGLGGTEGLMRLAAGFPAGAPAIRRTSMCSERI